MKNKSSVKNFKLINSVLGFVIGVTLIGTIYSSALATEGKLFTFKNIFNLHEFSYYYMVDLFPIILLVLGYLTGSYASYISHKLQDIRNSNELQSSNLLEFAEQLSQGNIETEYEPEKENTLGNILVELRNRLRKNKTEDEHRKKEDEQRNWIAEGLAKFGEILRHNNDNLEKLSYELISNLCSYISAVQGGFFMLNTEIKEDKHFELLAHYAYDRKKYNKRRLEHSEGLIGRSAYEKNTIYIDEIPEDYVDITSGLGEANPNTLLIVPLKVNEEVHGVIEFAAFNNFEKHVIDFVEKVAESIATTLATVKINIRTAKLLDDSTAQAERLSQQEEEMRQNMEELQATQEEAAKQSEEFISFTNSVNHTLIRAEYDVNGILLYANTKFLKKMGYMNNSEVEGHHISMFISDKDKEWFNEIWENLAMGGKHFEGYMKHMTKDEKDLWTMATYTCVKNADRKVEKILFLAIDTTEHKEQSLDYEGQIEAINSASMKTEYAPSGRILECNEKFIEALGYGDSEEMKDLSIYSFISEKEQNDFEDIWNKVINGELFQGQLKLVTKTQKYKWVDITLAASLNMYGEVSKIIAIANDITEQKELEILMKEQNKLLKDQEQKLKASEVELQKRLEEAKKEVKQKFQEIEKIKIRNEKTLEGAHDAIITIVQDGTVEFFNRAAENLWGYSRNNVLNKNITMLFKAKSKDEDEFIYTLLHPEQRKIVGERKEVNILNKDGEEVPVIILLAGAKVQNEYTYTAFIQNIEVELF